jgi:hypothetical protein
MIKQALARPDIKAKHRAANKAAQSRPEVRAASSIRMKEYRARPEVKAFHSARVSGDKNPSRVYRMTCENCGKEMSRAMFIRWKHGPECQK